MTKNMQIGLGLGLITVLVVAIFFIQKAVAGIMDISAASLNAAGIETDRSFELVPAKITGLTGNYENGHVTLSWNMIRKSKLNGYRIYRGSSKGAEMIVGSAFSSSFVDYDVEKGETYYYRVSAVNDLGEGTLSNSISIKAK